VLSAHVQGSSARSRARLPLLIVLLQVQLLLVS
jgi:hypothetical protein